MSPSAPHLDETLNISYFDFYKFYFVIFFNEVDTSGKLARNYFGDDSVEECADYAHQYIGWNYPRRNIHRVEIRKYSGYGNYIGVEAELIL